MDYFAIGQRIRRVRKAYGLSQEELAEKVGISTTHMSHIETGNTKLSLSVFFDLASALEVRADELLYDETFSERSAALDEIIHVLDSCTTQQIKIIEDIIKAAKRSMNKYL